MPRIDLLPGMAAARSTRSAAFLGKRSRAIPVLAILCLLAIFFTQRRYGATSSVSTAEPEGELDLSGARGEPDWKGSVAHADEQDDALAAPAVQAASTEEPAKKGAPRLPHPVLCSVAADS